MADGKLKKTGEQLFKLGQSGNPSGRPKGVPNKTTTLLKDAILQAAESAGGKEGLVGYLKTQAEANPQSFLPLLGKVLPTQLTGEGGGPIQTQDVTEDKEAVSALLNSLARRRDGNSEGATLQ